MRRQKRKKHEEVELNMAAMLDMAFQLLTFFILTFRPPPPEGQISLKLPPPAPITGVQGSPKVGEEDKPVTPVDSLVISVFANNAGDIEQMAVGPDVVPSKMGLEKRLKEVFSDPANPFEQVILQVDNRLRYDKLMEIIDVCTKQKFPNGDPLTKLSFVPAATGN